MLAAVESLKLLSEEKLSCRIESLPPGECLYALSDHPRCCSEVRDGVKELGDRVLNMQKAMVHHDLVTAQREKAWLLQTGVKVAKEIREILFSENGVRFRQCYLGR